MSAEDLERRISKLEENHDDLEASIIQLNTTIALLNQTVDLMAKNEEKRQQTEYYDQVFCLLLVALCQPLLHGLCVEA